MKRCYYFVAILLLLGGTFTSCLDNDEPVGIEQMRGAKAELYKAQAALQTAEIGIREADAKIKLAQAMQIEAQTKTTELDNQLKEMDLAIKQAGSDTEIARLNIEKKRYELQLDSVQEAYKATMLDLQKETSIAQHNYDIAIKELVYLKNKVNSKYTKQLEAITGKLTASMQKITNLKTKILDDQRDLVIFMARNDEAYIDAVLNAEVVVQEASLATAQTTLDKTKDIYGASVEDWDAKAQDLLATIHKIQVESDTLDMKKAEVTNTKAPYDTKILAAQRKLGTATDDLNEKNSSLELTIPTEIQDIFIRQMANGSDNDPYVKDITDYAKLDPNTQKWSLLNGDKFIVEGLTLKSGSTAIPHTDLYGFLYRLEAYTDKQAYSDENDAEYQEHKNALKGEMEYWAAQFVSDSAKWAAAKKDYLKARSDFKIGQTNDLRYETVEALKAFFAKKDKVKADSSALADDLEDYFTKRADLDGFKLADWEDKDFIAAVGKVTNLKAILDFYGVSENTADYSGFLGNSVDDILANVQPPYDTYYDINENNSYKGTEGDFFASCKQFWGVKSTKAGVNKVIIRFEPVPATEYGNLYNPMVTFGAPSAYMKYYTARQYEDLNNAIVNRAKWIALHDAVQIALDKAEADAKVIEDNIKSYKKEISKIETEVKMIAQQQIDILAQKATYNEILNVITKYLGGNNSSEVKDEEGYNLALASLKSEIEEQEKAVLSAQRELNGAKAELQAWKDGKGTSVKDAEEAITAHIASLNSRIEENQVKLEAEQKKFDIYTAEKNAFLEVVVGEEYTEE